MCGPSTTDFGGHGVLGEDAIDPAALRDGAAIFFGAAASVRPQLRGAAALRRRPSICYLKRKVA